PPRDSPRLLCRAHVTQRRTNPRSAPSAEGVGRLLPREYAAPVAGPATRPVVAGIDNFCPTREYAPWRGPVDGWRAGRRTKGPTGDWLDRLKVRKTRDASAYTPRTTSQSAGSADVAADRRGRRHDGQRHHPPHGQRLLHAGAGLQGRQPDRQAVRQRRL